ncbi:MAG: hypothetical protein PHN18_00620 [Sulfurospirillaceae bacterium]|nr:hypothetical protein [Sulfurospirillaceae bacterium]MDD2826158.1 hypothetical protein [Sulfurospirillaceae bacterium]
MEILITILQILALIGISFLAMFKKNYFPKYLEEKAKNTATKEDISQITEKIESIKKNHIIDIEKIKTELDVKSALRQSFQAKSLESLTAIDELLVEINLYSWKQLAERSPNEHYVWSNVDTIDKTRHFHYYRVAIDKIKMVHGLYLTDNAKNALSELAQTIGMLSSMELHLTGNKDDPVDQSAVSGYESAIKSVDKCRTQLMSELGIKS